MARRSAAQPASQQSSSTMRHRGLCAVSGANRRPRAVYGRVRRSRRVCMYIRKRTPNAPQVHTVRRSIHLQLIPEYVRGRGEDGDLVVHVCGSGDTQGQQDTHPSRATWTRPFKLLARAHVTHRSFSHHTPNHIPTPTPHHGRLLRDACS